MLILLAFSDEFVSAFMDAIGARQDHRWWVIPLDVVILAVSLWQKRRFRRQAQGKKGRRILLWWFAGAFITILLDFVTTVIVKVKLAWIDLAVTPGYVAALAMLLAATLDASPAPLLLPWRQKQPREEWLRIQAAPPLLIGTFGAYLATAWSEYALGRDIDQEYFAQVSQVIALLIVALGVELRYFKDAAGNLARRPMAIISLAILGFGEIMALSALIQKESLDHLTMDCHQPSPGQNYCDGFIQPYSHASDPENWHVYLAFIITVEACLIALSTLIWLLIVKTEPPEPPKPPARRPETARSTASRSQPAAARPERQVAAVAVAGFVAVTAVALLGRLRARRPRE